MIAQVSGRLAAKQADRVVVQTAGGVGYEIAVPLGVMEDLPAVGESVSLATKLGEFEEPEGGAAPSDGTAEAALKALERLGYGTAEADRALRDVLAADGGADTEALVRRALQLLTQR